MCVLEPPGLLVRAEPCIVYYGEYIDCILRAPVIVQAIQDSLNYTFNFTERRLLSVDFFIAFRIIFLSSVYNR
jgi:hypothetical protein